MEEKTSKSIKKTLSFEKSGETFSLEIQLENVSPNTWNGSIESLLDILYAEAKKSISCWVTY